MVYLFFGEDNLSKDAKIKSIKEEFIFGNLRDFNQDILYARELALAQLQEKILYLPLKSNKRIVIIKDAQDLKKEAQEFLLKYFKKPDLRVVLILDMGRYEPKDEFLNQAAKYAKVLRFKEGVQLNTFSLSRQIGLRKTADALRVLAELLKNGEKPERILGGLRYVYTKDAAQPQAVKKRFKILLNCDIDIKTGRIKPEFALERLVVRLCSLN